MLYFFALMTAMPMPCSSSDANDHDNNLPLTIGRAWQSLPQVREGFIQHVS